jgi:hypothetical protein
MTITLAAAEVADKTALRKMFDAYLAEASISPADYPDFDSYWDGGGLAGPIG